MIDLIYCRREFLLKKGFIDREKGGLERCCGEFLLKKGLSIARKVASRTPRDTLNIVPNIPGTIHTVNLLL